MTVMKASGRTWRVGDRVRVALSGRTLSGRVGVIDGLHAGHRWKGEPPAVRVNFGRDTSAWFWPHELVQVVEAAVA